MKVVVFLFLILASSFSFAKEVKPLYKLPEQVVVAEEAIPETKTFLAGSSEGLFKISSSNQAIPLWTDGAVEQIVRAESLAWAGYGNGANGSESSGTMSSKAGTGTSSGTGAASGTGNGSGAGSSSVAGIGTGTSAGSSSGAGLASGDGKFHEVWYFRTSKGILFSSDLENFELRNEGLPFLTLKKYDGKETTLEKKIHTLKDLFVNPLNSSELVTATKDKVYVSRDAGLSWTSIGSMSKATSGNKAVALVSMPVKKEDGSQGSELVVFMSHPIFGFSYYRMDAPKPAWVDIKAGFEMLKTMSSPDEISDILPVAKVNKDGTFDVDIYVSQTYIPRIYKFNFNGEKSRAHLIYSGSEPVDTIDGLTLTNDVLLYTKVEGIGGLKIESVKTSANGKNGGANGAGEPDYGAGAFDNSQWASDGEAGTEGSSQGGNNPALAGAVSSGAGQGSASGSAAGALSGSASAASGNKKIIRYVDAGVPAKFEEWKKCFSCVPGLINTAWVPYNQTGFKKGVCLNELWMLYPSTINTRYGKTANGKKSLYVSAYQCRLQAGIDKFRKIARDNKLNSIVIDMKDDYGLLRYDAKDPLVVQKGKITQYAVDLDHFVEEFKKDNMYLIARIVTFKDRNLANYGKSKYAVWNYKTNAPWVGIRSYEDVVDEESGEVTGKEATYYDENWVDPYCAEVWEYNVAVAKELIRRGFDEIQFDYIRFPTDGLNMNQISYRWRNKEMDKEGAIVSFLQYARENIDAPIGIDIYGANGWYRSGTRTGQDVEMMAEYVDVIGPMFYPSHFEQTFLNYEPFAERPYRIYFYGTYRNTIMARNRAIIRPWVQAFYLNVSYDRKYYNTDYVKQEIFGVRDAAGRGYMHWNNSGEYTTLYPDVGDDEIYDGKAAEADRKYRKPAIGSQEAPVYIDDGISILDQMYYYNGDYADSNEKTRFTSILQVPLVK